MATREEKTQLKCPYLSNVFLKILDDYSASHHKKERTRLEYRYVVYSLCNAAKRDFLDLRVEDISGFLHRGLKDGEKLTTENYNLCVIRSISRYIDENCILYSVTPQYMSLLDNLLPEPADRTIAPEKLPSLVEVDTAFAYMKESGDFALFIACSLALRCSLTIIEITNLEKSNFFQDLNGNFGLRLRLTPYAERFVKLPEDIADIIKLYSNTRKDSKPALLLTKRGTPMTVRTLQNRLLNTCNACNVKPFTFNALRTLSISYMLKGGAPAEKVAEYIDVKGLDWFFRYNRIIEELNNAACDYSHIKVVW